MKNVIKVKICNRWWTIRFLPSKDMDGDIGTTFSLTRYIHICNDYDYETTKVILNHELVHAQLSSIGKIYNHKYSEEEVAQFIAWNIDSVISIRDKILKERFEND